MIGEDDDPRIVRVIGNTVYIYAQPPPAAEGEKQAELGPNLGYARRRVADRKWEVVVNPGTNLRTVLGPFTDGLTAVSTLDKATAPTGAKP